MSLALGFSVDFARSLNRGQTLLYFKIAIKKLVVSMLLPRNIQEGCQNIFQNAYIFLNVLTKQSRTA